MQTNTVPLKRDWFTKVWTVTVFFAVATYHVYSKAMKRSTVTRKP